MYIKVNDVYDLKWKSLAIAAPYDLGTVKTKGKR